METEAIKIAVFKILEALRPITRHFILAYVNWS